MKDMTHAHASRLGLPHADDEQPPMSKRQRKRAKVAEALSIAADAASAPALLARVAAADAENARLREALKQRDGALAELFNVLRREKAGWMLTGGQRDIYNGTLDALHHHMRAALAEKGGEG